MSDERAEFDPTLQEADLVELGRVAGSVTKGTNISQLKFELIGSPPINTGSLPRVTSSDNPVFYQVFDGLIEEEKTVHDSTRAFVEGLGDRLDIGTTSVAALRLTIGSPRSVPKSIWWIRENRLQPMSSKTAN
jgi:hypothetical protein